MIATGKEEKEMLGLEKIKLLGYGFLLGTAGVKVLSSPEAKKALRLRFWLQLPVYPEGSHESLFSHKDSSVQA